MNCKSLIKRGQRRQQPVSQVNGSELLCQGSYDPWAPPTMHPLGLSADPCNATWVWDTLNDVVCIQVSCLGAADVSWVYSRVQLFVVVVTVSLLVLDYLILAITNPNEFCMLEEAQGAAHQRRMRRVYAYIGYFALSLPAWLATYVWQEARHCPYP